MGIVFHKAGFIKLVLVASCDLYFLMNAGPNLILGKFLIFIIFCLMKT